MKTMFFLKSLTLGLFSMALFSLFSFISPGGGGGQGGEEDCPPGFIWSESLQECVPMQWDIKPCYTAFGNDPSGDYYASCQEEGAARAGIMECAAISKTKPLPMAKQLQCLERRDPQ